MNTTNKTLAFLFLLWSGQQGIAQNFITQWNLATAGSGPTQLSFGTATSGTVNYTWQEISPGSATGSGSWSGATLTITGLPTGSTIRLQIAPTNFQRIIINNGSNRNRLTQVEQWGSTDWTSMEFAFRGCANLQVTATDVPSLLGVASMRQMFGGCTILNSPTNINNWNTTAVTNMHGVFDGASAFNQNIGTWNTGAVTDMQRMFEQASTFNQDIGAWNTAAVTTMLEMFYQASTFNQNIGAWNTAAVTDMEYMFYNADAFNQNIGAWNTASVVTMSEMFASANSFNQNIGAWNTVSVTTMFGMFSQASAFNQNIGAWTLNTAADLRFMFIDSGMDCNNYSATLIGWSANPSTPNSRMLGATGRQYGTDAVAARTNLTATKGWTITGDTPSGSSCGAGSITILPQPAPVAVCDGATASFTIGANGTTNILYQWQKFNGTIFTDVVNGGGYSGATSASFNVNTTGTFGAGDYRCKVSGDLAADVFSNSVTLTVHAIPAVPTSPVNGSSCGTAPVTLSVSGGANGQYRWYTTASGGTAIAGEVNDTYITPPISATTSYYASIDDGFCESGRTQVLATINNLPPKPTIISSITPTGGNVSVCSSNILTLAAPAGFSSYSWSNGEATQQITISTSGIYSVIVTNASGCASSSSDAITTIVIPAPCSNQSPVINITQATTPIAGKISIDLTLLISDADNNLDLATLKIVNQPASGATAQIIDNVLTIDYAGFSFVGVDKISIEVCDLLGSCAQQELTVNVVGDLIIHTGVSPNGDLFNEKWIIQNIEALPDTKENTVSIYNRWGDLVFETTNYDNNTRVFRGINNNGNEVTSGVYFYKIEFGSVRPSLTGYLAVKR